MGFLVTDVQSALKGADYPADGDDLAETAENNGADDELVAALRELPEVDGPANVMEHMEGQLGDD